MDVLPFASLPQVSQLTDILPTDIGGMGLLVLVAFVFVVVIGYKLFKVALNTVIAAVVGALFPWLVKYFNIDLPVQASLQNSMYFAVIAAALFLGWEFLHYIFWFFRLLTWPIRVVLGIEKKRKFKEVVREINAIKKARKAER
ncbi:MAG: hypothetical protein V1887_01655 [Candidatus Aenigmatarchaeota archaeon]